MVVYISPMSMQHYSNPVAPVHLPRTKSVLVTCGLFLALDVATSFRIADLGGRESRSETSKIRDPHYLPIVHVGAPVSYLSSHTR